MPEPPKIESGETPSSPSVSSENTEVDWDKMSKWCQGFLGLADTDLDSLWYERLADTAFKLNPQSEVVKELYKRALKKENPSWVCHRSLGEALFSRQQTPEAITQLGVALQKTDLANPKAEPKDILDLKMALADMTYAMDDFKNAAEYYLQVCRSEGKNEVERGELGLFKARLSFLDD